MRESSEEYNAVKMHKNIPPAFFRSPSNSSLEDFMPGFPMLLKFIHDIAINYVST